MNKVISASLAILLSLSMLSGCSRDDETKKQLAQLQAQLDAERAEKEQKISQEKAHQAQIEQEQREAELYNQAKEEAKIEMQTLIAEQASQEKAQQAKKKEEAKKAEKNNIQSNKMTEKLVRYPATVVTRSGYGQIALRGEPSSKGLEIGSLFDGNEVQVIAKTNQCEIIGNIEGCWVKVQLSDNNVKGYMFDGYLNREVLSQQEKQNLQGQSHSNQQQYNNQESELCPPTVDCD